MFSTIGFGAASREQLIHRKGSWEDIIAEYVRDTLGDYGGLTAAGRKLRRFAIPFWSWKEVNAKFYARFASNLYYQYKLPTKSPQLASELARLSAVVGKRAGVWLAVRAVMLYMVLSMFNNLVFPDEEEDLSDTDRRRLHLILGRAPDGSVIMFPTPGALSDLGQWIGMEDSMAAIDAISKGRGDLGDIAGAMSKGFLNSVVQGANPLIKSAYELMTGTTLFPDATKPRPTRSRTRDIARTLALDKYVEFSEGLMKLGKPTQGPAYIMAKMLAHVRHPGASAYNKMRSHAFQFKEHITGEAWSSGRHSRASNLFYYYRLAKKFGDRDAEKRYRQKMRDAKISPKRIRSMIKGAHPTAMLTKRQRYQFLRTLTDSEKRALKKATAYWRETFLR